MQKIELLTQAVANQIAAGEVVNRPASIVKEMMENSIDAGCNRISVAFRDGGKELISIIDDGSGMSPEDARMAFERHATSKIRSADDIYRLRTFGFRGEALASIAAVAQVDLLTRETGAELGSKVEISGGNFLSQSVVNSPQGSVFNIRNLFYNVPARRRFIDKSTTEAKHITAEFQRVALCNPEVAMELTNNDSKIYQLPSSSLRQRIVGVIGKSIERSLLDVATKTTIATISGFVGAPASAKQNNKEQFLFVNGRFFKSAYLHKAVISAYDKLISSTVQPSYFIYLEVDPQRIDVNVHPQKIEVKFEDSQALWQIINASVREALAKTGVVPMMDFDSRTSFEIPVMSDSVSYRTPEIRTNPNFNPFDPNRGSRGSMSDLSDFDAAFNAEPLGPTGEGSLSPLIEYVNEQEQQQSIAFEHHSDPTTWAAILPISERYFATTMATTMVVVDVKRAFEAVLYERYRTMIEVGGVVSQRLLFAHVMPLSIDDIALVGEMKEQIMACGIEISMPNELSVEITALPSELTGAPVAELLYDIIDALRDERMDAQTMRAERLALILSTKAAAARPKLYSTEELAALWNELQSSANPSFTPQGKQITVAIEAQEIKQRLK